MANSWTLHSSLKLCPTETNGDFCDLPEGKTVSDTTDTPSCWRNQTRDSHAAGTLEMASKNVLISIEEDIWGSCELAQLEVKTVQQRQWDPGHSPPIRRPCSIHLSSPKLWFKG